MAPSGNRQTTNQRAERAYQLRCMHRTLQEIADALGYRSRKSALGAIRAHMSRMPQDDIEIKRALTSGSYEIVMARLHRLLAKAEAADDRSSAAALARAIGEIEDRNAKLTGQHVPVATEVNVNVVQSMTEIVADTRARLHAAIDAEVVPLPHELTEG